MTASAGRITQRVVDLSHGLWEEMPQYATWLPGFATQDIITYEEHGVRSGAFSMATHLGTHIDAPSHFVRDGATMDQVPVQALIGPAHCVSVDLPAEAAIEVAHLEPLLTGAVAGDAVLIHTGWASRMEDESYLHHPYLADETAAWIVERGFRLVGTDTITPELPGPMRPENYPCPVHTTLLEAGVLILENLILDSVAGSGFTLVVGALKIVGGDGAPSRVMALFEDLPAD
jgi:arylformamidase